MTWLSRDEGAWRGTRPSSSADPPFERVVLVATAAGLLLLHAAADLIDDLSSGHS